MADENEIDDIVVVDDPSKPQEIDSSAEDDAAKKKKAARRGSDGNSKRGEDAQKKINAQWMKIKEKEQEAEHNASVAAAERAKNVEYEKITAAALEENLNTKRELLTERLTRAQESDDKKRVSEITAELSKVEAQAAQIDRYKIETQVNKQPQQKQPAQNQEPLSVDDLYERMSPAGKKWIDDNRDWYDTSGEDHDPEKIADVTYYAQTLESEYRASGRGAQIGTRAYYKEIDNYINNNWGDEVENEERDKPEPKRNYAAPVGNRNNASPTPQRKEYKITQAEKEMALSIESKGKDGKPLSDTDKIKRFVSLRENTPSSGPISMHTIRKGA